MAWQAYLRPEALPEYVAAAAMVGLAAWLLWLDARRLPNLAFALFLLSRAASTLSFTLLRLAETNGAALDAALRWERARAAFTIATVLTLGLFIFAYPKPRARPGRVVAVVLGGLVILELAYALRPDLWATYATTAGELAQTGIGPLFTFQLLRVPAFALAALMFARDWSRSEPGPSASALLLVVLAFGLHTTYDAANSGLVLLTQGAMLPPWTRVEVLVDLLAFLAVLAAALIMMRTAARRPLAERATVRRVLAFLPLPILTTAVVFLLIVLGADAVQRAASLFFLGLWRLSLPLLATYALVRHRLFGLDVQVKRSIHRTVVAVMFVLVFFAVSEGAENLFGGSGSGYGIVASALLALLLTPLERLAGRVADAAMPNVADLGELTRHQRRLLYRELARSAWSSGRISGDERKLLDSARSHLEISANDARRIESEAAPAPRKGRRRA